jgi:WD40 repeat protein
MITFACPACGQKLTVKTELGGKKGKCPHCGQPMQVPLGVDVASGARLDALTGTANVAGKKTDPGGRPGPAGDLLAARSGPVPRPANAETLPPSGGPASSSPETQATAPSGALPRPQGELYDFLAPPRGPGELGRLGPYRVLKVLGAGGMGVVYLGEDVNLKRPVALKAMLPGMGATPTARQRFIREARATAAVKHPHVVTVYFVGEDRGAPYLAMELLEGEPLDKRLDREKRPPLREALRIGREIAEGLAAAHARGLVHRDIKPGNVWLEGPGALVKVLDFGLARASEEGTQLTQQGAIVGTPAYMAPEQANGEAVDARCDLFSLGVVLYRMCTGQLPFQGRDALSTLMAVVAYNPPPPAEVEPTIPPALSGLVMRLLAKQPSGRPASAQAVAEELAALAADRTDLTPARSGGMAVRARAAPPAKGGRAGLLVGLLVLLLLAGAGALIALRPWDRQPGGDGQQAAAPGEAPGKDPAPGEPARKDNATIDPPGKDKPPVDPPRKDNPPVDPPRKQALSPEALAEAGGGDPKNAPEGLVAFLGKADTEKWGGVLCAAYSPDGQTLALGTAKGGVVLWDVASGKERAVLDSGGKTTKVAYGADGKFLAAATASGLTVWRTADGWSAYKDQRKEWGVDFCFSPDRPSFVTSSIVYQYTLGLRLYTAQDQGFLQARPEHERGVELTGSLAFSPKGDLLAAASITSPHSLSIYLRPMGRTGTPGGRHIKVTTDGPTTGVVRPLTFSSDGELLACAISGNVNTDHSRQDALVFEVATGKQLHTLKGHTASVHAVLFAPSGKGLATCGADGTVRLWDGQSGREGKVIRFPNGEVLTLAFSPDGRSLAAVGHGCLYVLRLPGP